MTDETKEWTPADLFQSGDSGYWIEGDGTAHRFGDFQAAIDAEAAQDFFDVVYINRTMTPDEIERNERLMAKRMEDK